MDLKKYAVIVAGGSGSRMRSELPKQFLMLNGKPVLYYTIKAFLDAYSGVHIILVLPEEHIEAGREIIDAYFDYKNIEFAIGGRTRFHSVQNGLKLVSEEGIVFVHDAVRCLCSPALIQKCGADVMEYGSSIPVVDAKDSMRIIKGGSNEAIDRSKIKIVQTPQAFHSKILLPAFASIDYKEHFTDEATVVESFGLNVHLTEGENENIKITYPQDILLAENILRDRFN